MAHVLSIDAWVKELSAFREQDFEVDRILAFMKEHAVDPATLSPYLFFSLGNYTRNLIFRNELCEVMTICWEIGQGSRIHNHRGQNCWMATPIGRLRVQNYRVEQRDESGKTCRLVPTELAEMDAAHPVAVNPLEPVHQVMNLPEFRQRAVSIHVYSKPFDSCEIYSLERGTYDDVPLHYTSVHGQLDPSEKLM
jgi:predicted metal-dependent enzyme (double-stranded beta helix superfamily)